MITLSPDAVCRSCQGPLINAWRTGEQLCSECGLSDELFHPHKRWITKNSDPDSPTKIVRPRSKNGGASYRSTWQGSLRFVLKVVAAIAPAAAEEFGARMFFTPRRARRATIPATFAPGAISFRLSLDEDEIACWSWGYGPAVILVHGWEGHAAQLIHFVQPLVAAGFRAVTFDMPAHGGSTGRRLSAFDMSRAIRAVSQIFAPVRGVIAHSLGGTASIFAVSQGLQIERAILIAPAAEPNYFAGVLATQLGFSNSRAIGMRKRIEDRLGMTLEEASTLRIVPKLTVPALVMHDPSDAEVPFEHGRRIAEAWPGARLELLYHRGHRRVLRDPRVISAAIAFIAEEDAKDALGVTPIYQSNSCAVTGLPT